MSVHVWEPIVRMIEEERDSAKVSELAKVLNEAMLTEEKEKVQSAWHHGRDSYSIVIR